MPSERRVTSRCLSLSFDHFIPPLSLSRLHLQRWQSVRSCFEDAQRRGRIVAAAALTPEAVSLDALDCSQPLLLAFGNERNGLSDEVPAKVVLLAVVAATLFAVTIFFFLNLISPPPSPNAQTPGAGSGRCRGTHPSVRLCRELERICGCGRGSPQRHVSTPSAPGS